MGFILKINMEITRRKVLQALGLGFGAVAVGGIGAAASLYLNNTKNIDI